MKLSAEDQAQIREIKQTVRGGRIDAGNPGHQVYHNAGGHGGQKLPPAPTGQAYHEYRLGGATRPAAGFQEGRGAAGARRLVMLFSQVEEQEIVGTAVCHAVQGAQPNTWNAIKLNFSGDYPSLLTMRQRGISGTEVPPAAQGPKEKACAAALGVQQGAVLCRVDHTFPPRKYPASANLPAAGGMKTIYFLRKTKTRNEIHRAWVTDDHYTTFSSAD